MNNKKRPGVYFTIMDISKKNSSSSSDSGGSGGSGGSETIAILGMAILGRMVLGRSTDVNLKKLNTPNIFLAFEEDREKLDAPVHRYAKAIREVAEYNSVYYVPIYEECGINKHNYENYLLSEYNSYGHHVYLHPNDAGAAKMMAVYLRHLQIIIQRAQHN